MPIEVRKAVYDRIAEAGEGGIKLATLRRMFEQYKGKVLNGRIQELILGECVEIRMDFYVPDARRRVQILFEKE